MILSLGRLGSVQGQHAVHFVAKDHDAASLLPSQHFFASQRQCLALGVHGIHLELAVLDRLLLLPLGEGLLDGRLTGDPHVKLRDPVLQCIDGHDAQHVFGAGALEQHIDECNHLDRLAQSHGVSQDATHAGTRVKLGCRLNHGVVHEANAADLMRFEGLSQLRRQKGVWLSR